jgi:hypothetical protein
VEGSREYFSCHAASGSSLDDAAVDAENAYKTARTTRRERRSAARKKSLLKIIGLRPLKKSNRSFIDT